MIRNAFIVDIKTGDIINKIVHDDEATYSPPKGCKIMFENEIEAISPKNAKGFTVLKDIGEKI